MTSISEQQCDWLEEMMADERNHDWFVFCFNHLHENGHHIYPGTPKTGPFSVDKTMMREFLRVMDFRFDANGNAL